MRFPWLISIPLVIACATAGESGELTRRERRRCMEPEGARERMGAAQAAQATALADALASAGLERVPTAPSLHEMYAGLAETEPYGFAEMEGQLYLVTRDPRETQHVVAVDPSGRPWRVRLDWEVSQSDTIVVCGCGSHGGAHPPPRPEYAFYRVPDGTPRVVAERALRLTRHVVHVRYANDVGDDHPTCIPMP